MRKGRASRDLTLMAAAAAVAAFGLTPAFAQEGGEPQPPPGTTSPASPGPASPSPASPGTKTPSEQQANTPRAAPQSATQRWRASQLIDRDVQNDQGQDIGEIEDIIIDNDGKVAGVVVSVGGFLGIGEKNVAIQFKDLTITRDDDGAPLVKSSISSQALETAPSVDED